jgi:predicted negative regulator of RcsB-dependent stress response
MALELMDEHEQGEKVRAWLRSNGGAIIGGVAIGLLLIFGYQWWERSKIEHKLTAATNYQALSDAIETKDDATASALATELAEKFSDTPYAALAALRVSGAKLQAGDAASATSTLESARASAGDPALQALVDLRLARVELGDGKAEAALQRLDKIDAGFAGLVAEARGDALYALGRMDDARTAYQDALTALDTGAATRNLVEMKLADLGGTPTAVAATQPGA